MVYLYEIISNLDHQSFCNEINLELLMILDTTFAMKQFGRTNSACLMTNVTYIINIPK